MAPTNFEPIVDACYQDVFRFALSLARDEDRARDLTQEAFYRLLAGADQLTDPKRVKAWLFTTLYREFLAGRRHEQRFIPEDFSASEDVPPALTAEFVEGLDAAAVMAALGDVDEVFRAPVALFYLEDLTYAEIAATLDVPLGTVMSRLARGKAQLRERLHHPARTARSKVVPLLVSRQPATVTHP